MEACGSSNHAPIDVLQVEELKRKSSIFLKSMLGATWGTESSYIGDEEYRSDAGV